MANASKKIKGDYMIFLVRTKPFEFESLSSYIHRVAEDNYTTPHEVWKLFLSVNYKYPDSSISHAIDASPDSVFNIKRFSEMLQYDEDIIYALSFVEVLRKLGIHELTRSRATMNLFEKTRRFCPDCLKDNNIYKLIWQVKEIPFCNLHNKYLSSTCSNCNKEIKILPNSPIGICPSCNFKLKYNRSINYNLSDKDILTFYDWQYLLDKDLIGIQPIKGFTIEQTIGIKIMYIVELLKDQYFTANETNHMARIKQIARGNLNTLHLNTIIYWVRKGGLSFSDFINLEIPTEYIDLLLQKKKKLADEIYCTAPWCNSYKKVGSLNKTSTSRHRHKDGEVSNYYTYCKMCGVEYSYDFNNSKVIERNYFISLAWNKVRNMLEQNLSLNDMATILKTSIDKISRSIIFLVSNNLFDGEYTRLKLPPCHDKNIICNIKSLINQNLTIKDIRKKLNFTRNEMLFYWFKSDVKICYIEKGLFNSEGSFSTGYERSRYYNNVLLALDYFEENKTTITIKGISEYLNITTSPLRDSGLNLLIKQAKINQRLKIEEENNINYIKLAKLIINEMIDNNEDIISLKVYENIGKKRTVLVRRYPEVTNEISRLIREGKANTN